MAKFLKLLTSAYVAGTLRHPHEGVLHVEDNEAARLLGEKAAEDVTSDFPEEANDKTPIDKIAMNAAVPETGADRHPHQSEIVPEVNGEQTPAPTPSRRRAPADKE